MSSSLLRVVARRGASTFFQANPVARTTPLAARAGVLVPVAAGTTSHFSTSPVVRSNNHGEETFEEFTARYGFPGSRSISFFFVPTALCWVLLFLLRIVLSFSIAETCCVPHCRTRAI